MLIQTVEIAAAPRPGRRVAICPVCGDRGIFMVGAGHGTQVSCIGKHVRRECKLRKIQVGTNPDQKCDVRCTSARGFTCNCSCGGKNHGVDLMFGVAI